MNFTGFRLINPEDETVMEVFNKYKDEWKLNKPEELKLEPALMYDAVQLFAQTLEELIGSTNWNVKELSCNGSMSWEHGSTLLNFMRVVGSIRMSRNILLIKLRRFLCSPSFLFFFPFSFQRKKT